MILDMFVLVFLYFFFAIWSQLWNSGLVLNPSTATWVWFVGNVFFQHDVELVWWISDEVMANSDVHEVMAFSSQNQWFSR